MSECSICCEKFNKRTRAPIKCMYCSETSCVTCIKGNITSNGEDKHCLFCGSKWDRLFIINNFGVTFSEKFLRPHQEKTMVDSEIARLPETQTIAKLIKETQNLEHYKKSVLEDQIKTLTERLVELKAEKRDVVSKINYNSVIINSDDPEDHKDFQSGEKYSIKCPMNDCNGYMNNKYVCGTCSKNICKECYEEKLENHECNADRVETIKEIKKDSKACPGCGERISKIDGCDQMWCIICKKAFSWRTGRIEKGPIHNPEYFRWINQNATEAENRENQENPEVYNIPDAHNNCVVPNVRSTLTLLRNNFSHEHEGHVIRDDPIVAKIMAILRVLLHIDNVSIVNNNQFLASCDKKKRFMRADYINGKITLDKWKELLFKLNKDCDKRNALGNIYQLFKIVLIQELWKIIDICNSTIHSKEVKKSKVLECIAELEKIRNFANTSFEQISCLYKSTQIIVGDNWML